MPKKNLDSYVSDFLEEDNEEKNKPSGNKGKSVSSGKARRKRIVEAEPKKEESDEEDVEDEEQLPVTTLLQQFGSDMKKTINAKRRKLEAFAKQCTTSQERVDAVLQTQKADRQKLNEEYKKQVSAVLKQWEADIDKAKETDDKLNSLINQQLKLMSQVRMVQMQRFKSMKQLHDQYAKSMTEVEATHSNQHGSLNGELTKEMETLQKKFLQDSSFLHLAQAGDGKYEKIPPFDVVPVKLVEA